VYQTFVGKGTALESGAGTRLGEFLDGAAFTILVVEAAAEIPWTRPDELVLVPHKPVPELGGSHPGGFLALFTDGSVRFLRNAMDEKILRAFLTRNGGESLPPP
jgi:hypothetical protein